MRRRERSARSPARIIAAGALSLSLYAPAALAQTTGDKVRITTDAGTIDGTLVDRLPEGYLVRLADGNHVVPYTGVKSIVKVDAAPASPPKAAPQAPPPAPASTADTPVVVLVPQEPPAVQGPYYAPGTVFEVGPPRRYSRPTTPLMAGGKTLLSFGIVGLIVGSVLSPVGHAIKAANTCQDPSGSLRFSCEYGNGSALAAAGDINLVVGTLLTAGGIAMMIAASTSRTTALRMLPSISIAPRGAALRFTF